VTINVPKKKHLYKMQYHDFSKVVDITKAIFVTPYETGSEAEITKFHFGLPPESVPRSVP